MARDVDYIKPTLRYLITFAGEAMSWLTKIQKCVALSTTEVEYIAATEACKKMLWMKNFLHELCHEQQNYMVHCDNQVPYT